MVQITMLNVRDVVHCDEPAENYPKTLQFPLNRLVKRLYNNTGLDYGYFP